MKTALRYSFRFFCFCCVLCCVTFDAGFSVAFARPAQVILLRHAEKTEDPKNIHLSEKGYSRAKALPQFFAEKLNVSTNKPPAALFATRPTRRAPSVRSRETVEPLAKSLNLTIQQPQAASDFPILARRLLENPAFDGKTVVVCWTHDELGDFCRALGADPKPKEWKGSAFDRAWVVTFTSKKVKCKTVYQELLPGDSKEDSD